ncbi:DUF2851 family protein [Lutibacter sp.]|uniref:DUF2851 family protein n=1 Tax=Lutibacter sp. TaxID=1925666 RepID=UPI0027332B37|nr:DUF2851 family protein [Lutibacter sp.]MDP3314242.1 DUF2851 family protein [Lutibacter sp.]
MKESLLQFIWKLKLFSITKLCGSKSELIEIVSVGLENTNAGPDFLNAKIRINGQLWAGNVEIHVKSSDWYAHSHEADSNYDAVILHVVWENDMEIFNTSNKSIPTIELKHFILPRVLTNYQILFEKKKEWINCEKSIKEIDNLVLYNWLERMYFERLELKEKEVKIIFDNSNSNWEETLFILLAKNFGLKINAEAFFQLANSTDFSIVRKVSSNLVEFEALLFGQAGMLSNKKESEYYNLLQKEYHYLKTKFLLHSIVGSQIQFFRLRPSNFPTIRLAQLAMLYHLHQNLFSKLMEAKNGEDFYTIFNIRTSDFWENHFTFEKESKKTVKKLSKSFIDLIIINTILPIKLMYLKQRGVDDAGAILEIIETLKPEKNTIVSNFEKIGVTVKSAFETQALLQLKNEYCTKQQCLKCMVGKELLKN